MALTPTAAQSTAAKPAHSDNALTKLTSNFGNFLTLLMTQLKNQDPTSPLDTNQFTSQLVQFSSVEQQIATNSGLTRLIELTQASEVMQSSSMIGKQVTIASDRIPLQNGVGRVGFTATNSGPVAIGIVSESGMKVRDASLNATRGANDWTWDGLDNNGRKVADGAYKIAVIGADSKGTAAAIPFTVTGVATGVSNRNNAVSLQLGQVSVGFGAVQEVGSTP